MKLLSKIFNSLITDLYKIDILRTTIVIIRFIFLFHIRKKIKYYIDPNKKIDDHIIVPREDGSKKTVITHNMRFIENFLIFAKLLEDLMAQKQNRFLSL